MSPHDEHAFQNRIGALYRRTADEVDTATAARLRSARHKALEARDAARWGRWLFPLGAVATGLLAVVLIWPSTHKPPAAPAQPARTVTASAAAGDSSDSALPPDPDNTDPTMYQDMEFYAWLADHPSNIARRRGG